MKSIHDVARGLAQHLSEAMATVSELPDQATLTSFIKEGLRYQLGAATTDLQPMSSQPDGHGGISMMPVGHELSRNAEATARLIHDGTPDHNQFRVVGDLSTGRDTLGALSEQVGGSHYKNDRIQHAEFCQVNEIPWCEAAAIKYLVRHKRKHKAEDLRKAIHYTRIAAKLEYNVDI